LASCRLRHWNSVLGMPIQRMSRRVVPDRTPQFEAAKPGQVIAPFRTRSSDAGIVG
jgi:hypothetical protein